MHDKYDFQEPLNIEPDGTYITVGQMQFFLNRDDGKEKFKAAHSEFMEYYNICRVYNLVSDIMKEDEEAAIMYWDDNKKVVSMGFPTDGVVAKALGQFEPQEIYEQDEDDEYGLLDDTPWTE